MHKARKTLNSAKQTISMLVTHHADKQKPGLRQGRALLQDPAQCADITAGLHYGKAARMRQSACEKGHQH